MGKSRGGRKRLRFNLYRSAPQTFPQLGPEELLLEFITDSNLQQWRIRAPQTQEYHYLWFFELESQRAVHQTAISEALATVGGISVDVSEWGRVVKYRYSDAPLSCVGSLKWVGGRFNYGEDIDRSRFAPFPALYLAQDLETGLRESLGLTQSSEPAGLSMHDLALCQQQSLAWLRTSGVVHNVFDLSRSDALQGIVAIISKFKLSQKVRDLEKRLDVRPLKLISSASELHQTVLTENWREFPSLFNTPSNSQLLANLLVQAGYEGVLFSSTKTGKKNLAVFPRQLANSGSIIEVTDAPQGVRCRILSSETFREVEV